MKIISDLHTHTYFSDGKWSPEELIEEAHSKGIRQISIVDHNTINAIERAKKKAESIGINFVKGVEIDVKTEFEGETFHNHLLGYNFDENKLKKFVEEIKGMNKMYFEKLISNLKHFLSKNEFRFNEPLIEVKESIDLNKINVEQVIKEEYSRKYKKDLTPEEFSFVLENKFLGPEIIHRFIKNNLVENPLLITDKYPTTWKKVFVENFKEIFDNGKKFYKNALDTITAIRDSGGVTILAHPFLDDLFWDNTKKEKYINFITFLVKSGLNGLEIYYYENDRYNKEEQDKLNEIASRICKNNNLLYTYGSDCHGGQKIFLGKFGSGKIISFEQ